MNITFVVSSGRAGSTLLSQILHRHPDVLSVSEFYTVLRGSLHRSPYPGQDMDGAELWRILTEPDLISDALVRHGMNGPEMLYPYGKGRFGPAEGIPPLCHSTLPMLASDPDALFDELAAEVPRWPERPAADQYRAFFAHLASLLGRRVVVERSGGTLFAVPLLHREFPEARFVHMFRDGPDCALSMSRLPIFRVSAAAYSAAAEAGLPTWAMWKEIQENLPERFAGILSPPFDLSRLAELDPGLPFFGEWWSSMMTFGAAALGELPTELWQMLGYADLLTDPEAVLTRLAAFIGVDASPAWLAEASELIDPGRAGKAAGLAPDDLATLRKECEPGEAALAQARQRAAGG
ncbi:MAG TPA: sulfotransferase [Streptosporangiaceae bacterium]|nr:sulfotransferase [Streptosporangiaceae bacterium]